MSATPTNCLFELNFSSPSSCLLPSLAGYPLHCILPSPTRGIIWKWFLCKYLSSYFLLPPSIMMHQKNICYFREPRSMRLHFSTKISDFFSFLHIYLDFPRELTTASFFYSFVFRSFYSALYILVPGITLIKSIPSGSWIS